ncbi:MAG TPA: alpha/beta hydrolase [Pyrinomonadaceae bacterium]|jgi:pimeloyl-ACP methyl ester carboxylesterase|nr:alpha/beta hydrolase [Pyrinomonadaceae bacterium]
MKKRNIAFAVAGVAAGAVAIKMLTRAATVDFEDVADLVPHADRSRFVHVDGMRVHYQEFARPAKFGDAAAPPVILIHGYTASVYSWKTAAPMIADSGFRVIAIDLIGFGYSDKPRSFDYSIESQARMITRFMDRLGLGTATIVGCSYGGAVAATVALDYPERVDKLVLVDAVINDDLRSHPILQLVRVPGIGEIVTPFLADSRTLLRHRMLGTLAEANHHLITEDRVDSIRRPLMAADGHHSLLATSRNWRANRITRDAHLIEQPTLIVWGEDDTVISVQDGYTLRDSIPGSRLFVIKDCGHVPQEESGELFSKMVAEFAVIG